jgi:hypothetical protein
MAKKCPMYLRNINASPATNLFELTKTLQPVVSRCRLGCPETQNIGRHEIKPMRQIAHMLMN